VADPIADLAGAAVAFVEPGLDVKLGGTTASASHDEPDPILELLVPPLLTAGKDEVLVVLPGVEVTARFAVHDVVEHPDTSPGSQDVILRVSQVAFVRIVPYPSCRIVGRFVNRNPGED